MTPTRRKRLGRKRSRLAIRIATARWGVCLLWTDSWVDRAIGRYAPPHFWLLAEAVELEAARERFRRARQG